MSVYDGLGGKMANEEWLTVQEAAERLKVHAETVRVWLRDGRLKGTQPMSRRVGWRIQASEIDRLLCGEAPAGKAAA